MAIEERQNHLRALGMYRLGQRSCVRRVRVNVMFLGSFGQIAIEGGLERLLKDRKSDPNRDFRSSQMFGTFPLIEDISLVDAYMIPCGLNSGGSQAGTRLDKGGGDTRRPLTPRLG